MLDELCKKDALWRELALRICGNKTDADDIVNEMYLRRHTHNRGQQTTDYYIVCTMRSIFLNMKKTNKLILVRDIVSDIADVDIFETDDTEQYFLNKAKNLSYTQRELLELNYDNSLRDIQDRYGINYSYVHRAVTDARKKILGKNINEYKNKRLKYMKQSRGLGDTIEKVLSTSGIKRLVALLSNGKDCGCEKRKETLNQFFSYKLKPNCLTEYQIAEYKNFIDTRKMKLINQGKAEGELNNKEKMFVTQFYADVFNVQKLKLDCSGCNGTAKKLIDMIYKLDVVFVNNIPEKKEVKKRVKKLNN